jgi:DNA-binding transcriptional LysR family regulator
MPADLRPDLLRTFLAVADSQSFTAAAARLNRTQSAVSMQIRRLEDLVGEQLLERTHRSVELTEKGEGLLPRARQLVELNDALLSEIGLGGVNGRVRIGLPEDFTAHFLPPVLASFAEACPQVEMEITCGLSMQLLQQLAAGDIDIALVAQEAGGAGTPVRREQPVWVASANHDTHLQRPVPLALFPKGCVFRAVSLAAMRAAGHPVRPLYTSASVSGIRAAVSAGLAVAALLPETLPDNAMVLDDKDGFPPPPDIEVALHLAPSEKRRPVLTLAEYIVRTENGVADEPAPTSALG